MEKSTRQSGRSTFHPLGSGGQREVLWTLALIVAISVPFVAPFLRPGALVLWADHLSLLAMAGVGTMAALRASRRASAPRERRFWALWATAMATIVVARMLYLSADDLGLLDPLVDGLYVLFYALLVASLHLRPDREPAPEAAQTKALELASAGVFLLALVAYYLVIPAIWTPDTSRNWTPSMLLYGTMDVYLVAGLLYLARSAGSAAWRRSYYLLGVAAAGWLATDTVETLVYLEVMSWWASGGALDLYWLVPYAMVAGVSAAYSPSDGPPPPAASRDRALSRVGLTVGYTLILTGLHLFLSFSSLVDEGSHRPREALLLVVLPTLLLIAQRLDRAGARHMEELDLQRRSLERQRGLLAAALEQTTEAVLLLDPEGHIEYVNASGTAGLSGGKGWKEGENLPGILESTDPHGAGRLRAALDTGVAWEGQVTCAHPTAGTTEAHLSVSPVRPSGSEVELFAAILQDKAREMELEARIQQGQRLEALGTLAGGVAHEFNNLLSAILGFSELLREDLSHRGDDVSDLDSVIHAAERGRLLTTQILAFSRRQQASRGSARLGEAVEESVRLLRATLPTTVIIDLDSRPELGPIWADVGQLHQTVMNLGANASHAMRGHGHIRIRVREERLAEGDVTGLSAGEYAVLVVEDDGSGMDRDTAVRVFEPFFTTKIQGEGTGLGLSVVHGIVAGHGGSITLDTAPGCGSTFTVYLPLWKASRGQDDTTPSALTRRSRVLVLEPEPELAAMASRMLERSGFQVQAFHHAGEALDALAAQPDHWDVLVTSQAMPGISGLDVAREAQILKAGLPVVLTTTSITGVALPDARAAGVREILSRPYSAPSLAQGVRTALAPVAV